MDVDKDLYTLKVNYKGKRTAGKANKGNKKLYLPVENKTNSSTNWKTKLEQGAKWKIKQ